MIAPRRCGASGALCVATALCGRPGSAAASPAADDTWTRPERSERPSPPPWRTQRIDARLVVAVSPTLGPHVFGNQKCNSNQALCDRAGRFLGIGATTELRVGLYKVLYAHARVLGAGNVIGHKPVFKGLLAPGLGLGVYGKLAFIRAEYLFYVPLGGEGCTTLDPSRAQACDDFEVPFETDEAAEAIWSPSGGMISGGLRYRLTPRMVGELWAGLVVGPRERRWVLDAPETRVLTSFVIGLGLAFDVVQ